MFMLVGTISKMTKQMYQSDIEEKSSHIQKHSGISNVIHRQRGEVVINHGKVRQITHFNFPQLQKTNKYLNFL